MGGSASSFCAGRQLLKKMESSSPCNKTDCVLVGLRRKPGNAAGKREYGKWQVIGSNLPHLDLKEIEEGHIEGALRKSGDSDSINF